MKKTMKFYKDIARFLAIVPNRLLFLKNLCTALVLQFLIFFSAHIAIAQSSSAPIVQLQQNLENYLDQNLQEKLYVHLDRNNYLTGETMWFKIYYTDATTNRPLNVSKVAYVEIVDADSTVRLQTMISINDKGTGNGSLFLPSSLSSGNYIVRAYTSWMKNFRPEFYFHQSFSIINPFSQLSLPDFNQIQSLDIHFFPEGGDLVVGLQSTVAFKSVDQTGKGVDITGVVVNDTGEIVARLEGSKYGIGSFQLRPEKRTYRAIVMSKGKDVFFDLPKAKEQGFVMKVHDYSDDFVKVEVNGSFRTMKSFESDKNIYLLIHAGQKIVKLMKASLDDKMSTSIEVYKNDLAIGISHFTIFDNEAKPVCERSYFKSPNKFTKTELTTDKRIYGNRSKILVEGTNENFGEGASISMSVYRIDSLNNQSSSLYNYLWLTSELKGRIENPSYYFENAGNRQKLEAIDRLMLVHGWSRFAWEDINTKEISHQFYPEIRGPVLQGLIVDKSSQKPALSKVVWLSSGSTTARPYASVSDEMGRVKFEMMDLYGSKKYVVVPDQTNDSIKFTVDISNPYSTNFAEYGPQQFDLPEAVGSDISQRSIHMQVGNILAKDKGQSKKPTSLSFYGSAPYKYVLDDYTRFPTMEEVLREFVPRVVVRRKDGKFNLRIVEDLQATVFTKNPLILIDGVPVFDNNKLMEFDPLLVEKLEILSRKYYLGDLTFEGVLSFITYDGSFDGFDGEERKIVKNFYGLQYPREFYAPIYETDDLINSRIPDVRNLLFWEPNIIPDKDGKFITDFYTSDISGKYVVEIQGMDASGNCTDARVYFAVGKQYVN